MQFQKIFQFAVNNSNRLTICLSSSCILVAPSQDNLDLGAKKSSADNSRDADDNMLELVGGDDNDLGQGPVNDNCTTQATY
jgi:hypothetical protein